MKEIYSTLYTSGPTKFISMLRSKSGQDDYFHLCSALAYAWLGRKEEAEDILVLINLEHLLIEERVIFLETKLMFAYWKKNFEEAKTIALEALSLSDEALFSNELIAKKAFYKKELHIAVKHYSKILEVHPNHENTIANLAITLFRQNDYKKAIDLVGKIQSGRYRLFYKWLLWLMRPEGKLFALVCLLILYLVPGGNVHVYIYIGIVSTLIILFFSKILPKNNLANFGLISFGLFVTGVWGLSILLLNWW
ncbi:MAG: hypothetical protein QGD88_02925 [Anaerolineae bacterium]|nr:hypothetical protein [Anaerolineae bacterium]